MNITNRGRLEGTIFYLAGPIDNVSKGDAMNWRNYIKKFLWGRGAGVIDPCDKPCTEYQMPEIESSSYRNGLATVGRYDELSYMVKNYIRHPDLRYTDKADVLICYVDLDVVMCGTWEEIFSSNRAKKPILCVVKQGKNKCPHWLLGTISHQNIFSTWDELEDYLVGVDEAAYFDGYGRWVFLDFDKIFGRKHKMGGENND